jgi:hypothetical protein
VNARKRSADPSKCGCSAIGKSPACQQVFGMLATIAPGMGDGSVMVAVRKRGSVRLTRWVLIPLAAAVSLLGLAGPAGASGSPSAAAPTLANVVSVASAPTGHSICAVLSTGHVVCWGDNQAGELGNGTATGSDVPVAVLAPN